MADFALVPSQSELEFLPPSHTHVLPDTPTLKSIFFNAESIMRHADCDMDMSPERDDVADDEHGQQLLHAMPSHSVPCSVDREPAARQESQDLDDQGNFDADAMSSLGSSDDTSEPSSPASQRRAIGRRSTSVSAIPEKMKTHVIARGRRRKHQLAAMTEEEKELENAMRLEKNRLSAIECRKRKKQFIHGLAARIAELEEKDRRSQEIIARLQSINANLLATLQAHAPYQEAPYHAHTPYGQ